jgi:hypothetical protein
MNLLLVILQFTISQALPADAVALSASGSTLELGYRQMYNLQFEDAHKSFESWARSHPDDPLGYSSNAAAFLYSEFSRLGVLQAELFEDDENLKQSRRLMPDPVIRQEFETALARSDRLADTILARSTADDNALFAKILNQGLRSDYAGLIEKRFVASLGYMKGGRALAEKLLTINPEMYDAYLAIGVENYVLGSSPAPLRWLLRVFGSQTDKMQGIENVRLTAEKGHYLLPFARLLLAVAALRDKNRDQARDILSGLAREFPNNPLYSRELARIH